MLAPKLKTTLSEPQSSCVQAGFGPWVPFCPFGRALSVVKKFKSPEMGVPGMWRLYNAKAGVGFTLFTFLRFG